MENIQILIEAIEYIEENLTESIKTEDIANHLYCSKSTIEKLFKYMNNISIRDYIIRRRMSRAAKDLIQTPEKSLLEIGMQYGYGSNEAFTRAFQKVWLISPSDFRKNPSNYELFPGFRLDPELMEEKSMADTKKVDISELYDYIRDRKNCFIVLGDIMGMISFNDISRKTGDLAIITALNRMESSAGSKDLVFRIGGDEFAILTDSIDENYAKSLCEKIIAHNGEVIECDSRKVPLSLYVKAVRYEGTGAFRYSDFFTSLKTEMNKEYKAVFLKNKN